MQVSAHLRNLRMSPRKVRLVVDMVRGLPVSSAVQHLEFSSKAAARPVLKLLKSAMANAEHNGKADVSKLRVAKITADAGATLHRWRARAHGRAAPIRKRTSHISVILSDESPADVHRSQIKGGKRKHQDKDNAKKAVTTSSKKEKKSADKKEVKKPAEKKSATASKEGVKKSEKKPEVKKASFRRNDATTSNATK